MAEEKKNELDEQELTEVSGGGLNALGLTGGSVRIVEVGGDDPLTPTADPTPTPTPGGGKGRGGKHVMETIEPVKIKSPMSQTMIRPDLKPKPTIRKQTDDGKYKDFD